VDILRLISPTSGAGLVLLIVLVVLGALAALLRWERYRPRQRPVNPFPTTEVFIDPSSHRRLRVWIDPVTGAREYRDEPEWNTTALPPLERPGLLLPQQPEPPRLPGPPDDVERPG
jgi:hypothetical protein